MKFMTVVRDFLPMILALPFVTVRFMIMFGISVGTYDTLIEGNEIYDNEVGIRYGFGYGKSECYLSW